jgi:hypothetical protein
MERIWRAKYRPFIILRPGEPRCALWQTDLTDSKTEIQSVEAIADNELVVNDIKNNTALMEIVKKARTIYISSVKCPGFTELFEFLIKNQNVLQNIS